MTTQDTITIDRELGEWLHSLALVPRAGSAQPQRYTADAARGFLEDAIKNAIEARTTSPLTMGARILELEGRCEQLGKLRGEAQDTVSRLGQALSVEEAKVSELQGDLVDARDLAETTAAAQASRIQAARTRRSEVEANLRTSREYNSDLVEENRATKELLAEATAHIEAMTAKGLEADVDTLEALAHEGELQQRARRTPHRFDLTIDHDHPRLVAASEIVTHEIVLRVVIEQPPLTPATTPEENKAFDDR